MNFNEIFQRVEYPSRYINKEKNSIKKKWGKNYLKVALCYPDLYEVGMSHIGFQILYHYINKKDNMLAERVFAPGKDMEFLLRENNIPLFSLENKKSIKNFDILGFSLLSELTYTNLLNILDLSGIPVFTKERKNNHPIVFAGGINVFNPEPLTPFIDVFYVGDAEASFFNILEQIKEYKDNGEDRKIIIKKIKNNNGIYIPGFYKHKKIKNFFFPVTKNNEKINIKKAVLKDIDLFPLPSKPIVPNTQIVFDRLSVEIARGCPQKCRFCQATFVYHPFRNRTYEYLLDYIENTILQTGFEQLSLSSLSSTDYPYIERLMKSLYKRLQDKRVSISLPSLRPKKLEKYMLDLIKKTRKTGLTIVPEAGTERLRKVINKDVTDEEIYSSLNTAFKLGWRKVKFYFILGLPTETMKDIQGIADILIEASNMGRKYKKKLKINATISVFIPQPHTPFQWCSFAEKSSIYKKQKYLLNQIKSRKEIFLKFNSYNKSMLECLLSRGDKRVANIIYNAFKNGAKFDAWISDFDFKNWEKAIAETGDNPDIFLSEIKINEPLPYDFIDTGIKKEFLIKEYKKSNKAERTAPCTKQDCFECRGCYYPITTFKKLDKKITEENYLDEFNGQKKQEEQKFYRYIIYYSKLYPANYLSNLETTKTINRILRRSGYRFRFTRGFHPKIKISFLFADPLGTELEEDILEVHTHEKLQNEALVTLNNNSIKGLEFKKIIELEENTPRISKLVKEIHFKIKNNQLKENFQEIINESNFPEFKKFLTKSKNILFIFDYNPHNPFRPYKLFKEIMKDYLPFDIKKTNIKLK